MPRNRYFVPSEPSDPTPPHDGHRAHHTERVVPFVKNEYEAWYWYVNASENRKIMRFRKADVNYWPVDEAREYIDPRLFKVRVRYPFSELTDPGYREGTSYGRNF